MAVERVVVEAHFGVDGHQSFFAAGFDDAERIDFDKGGVVLPPGVVDALEEFGAGVDQAAPESERGGQAPGLVWHEAERGIDCLTHDLFGSFGGDFFDVHASLSAGHDDRARGGAVQENGQVEFLFDVQARRPRGLC